MEILKFLILVQVPNLIHLQSYSNLHTHWQGIVTKWKSCLGKPLKCLIRAFFFYFNQRNTQSLLIIRHESISLVKAGLHLSLFSFPSNCFSFGERRAAFSRPLIAARVEWVKRCPCGELLIALIHKRSLPAEKAMLPLSETCDRWQETLKQIVYFLHNQPEILSLTTVPCQRCPASNRIIKKSRNVSMSIQNCHGTLRNPGKLQNNALCEQHKKLPFDHVFLH